MVQTIDWKEIKPTDKVELRNGMLFYVNDKLVIWNSEESNHANCFLNAMVGVTRRLRQ